MIRTAKATYNSRDHFEQTHEDTRTTSGQYYSMAGTLDYDTACYCA